MHIVTQIVPLVQIFSVNSVNSANSANKDDEKWKLVHLVLLVRNLDPGSWIQARGSRLEILQIVQIVPDLALQKCLHRNFSNISPGIF